MPDEFIAHRPVCGIVPAHLMNARYHLSNASGFAGWRRLFLTFVFLGAARALLFGQEADSTPPPASPEAVINFAMLDQHGRHHELYRVDARVVVLFFTGNGCPIARQSVSKLRALSRKFAGQNAVLWMINSNPQDDLKSIAAEARSFGMGSIPVLKDDTQGLARTLGVRRTAEAICIDTKDWTIFYRGAIDDQLVEGRKKPEPSQSYLETALTEFFAGKTITQPRSKVAGCLIHFESAASEPGAPISYAKQVAPILQNKCVSCHSPGNIGPFSFSSYQRAKGWSEMIREVILSKRMPPWHAHPHHGVFHNDRSLSTEEAQVLLQWIEQGAPRGEGDDPLAVPLPEAETWRLGKPDYVVALPKPQSVPATGVLNYRYVDVPSPIKEDVWLKGVVIRPDNKKVVHHVIVRVKYPGRESRPAEEVFFAAWAPGNTMAFFPEDTGKFLPKGASFTFELHYNTTGKPETDRSEMGLYLMEKPPRLRLETREVANHDLNIPPGEPDARSFAVYGFKRDALIYDLIPHMHLRGSWFQYEALYPNGAREILLHVPHYDFNWQTEYRLAEPKRVPAGTWILCTGGHDNSARNPSNPDPARRVRFGLQSFDEMFIGFMNVAELPTEPATASSSEL
jgi:peroxiredoxin